MSLIVYCIITITNATHTYTYQEKGNYSPDRVYQIMVEAIDMGNTVQLKCEPVR